MAPSSVGSSVTASVAGAVSPVTAAVVSETAVVVSPQDAIAGTVSSAQALEKAQDEYRKYQAQTLSPVEEAYLDTIRSLESTAKKKSREKKS